MAWADMCNNNHFVSRLAFCGEVAKLHDPFCAFFNLTLFTCSSRFRHPVHTGLAECYSCRASGEVGREGSLRGRVERACMTKRKLAWNWKSSFKLRQQSTTTDGLTNGKRDGVKLAISRMKFGVEAENSRLPDVHSE